MKLSEEAEEVATFYGRMLDHDYTTKEVGPTLIDETVIAGPRTGIPFLSPLAATHSASGPPH